MARARLVVGNWKMNPLTLSEALDLARAVGSITHPEHVIVGVAPPALYVEGVASVLRRSGVSVYSQDVHWEDRGAHTGQISAAMFAPHATGSIVGHSEVRRELGDDDARVALKATAALRRGLSVIYCVGESLGQRERGETGAVIATQIRDGVARIDRSVMLRDGQYRVAIAYEPVWAIGTGVVATPEQASAAIAAVRSELDGVGLDGASATVLYGGSVSAANCAECAGAEGVDGALVGGASLKPDEFAAIVAAFR